MHEARVSEIQNPGSIKDTKKIVGIGTTLMMLGLIGFFIQYRENHALAWGAYLEGYFFTLGFGLFGLFFIAVNHVTASVWIIPFRRVCEALSSFLIFSVILLIPIAIFKDTLYPWAQPGHAHLTGTKAAWLSSGFWDFRIFLYIIVWALYANHYRTMSLRQDDHKQNLNAQSKSSIFLVIFGFSYCLFAFDLLMALRPHWYSTMYGVYCFAGLVQSGLSMMILFILMLKRNGFLNGVMKERHLFDAGTWLLAWCTFMCYIGFSQFMLIWYANLPEETVFFRDHLFGEWKYLYIAIYVMKWGVPFLVLMPKPFRRNPIVLTVMACWLIFANWLDIYWMVTPEVLSHDETARALVGQGTAFGKHFILSLMTAAGFLGAYLIVVNKFLSKNSVVAYGEPKLLSSVNGDYL